MFDEAPWTAAEAWRRVCHEHDEMVRFMDGGNVIDEDTRMARNWLPPPARSVGLCVDGSFRSDNRCMGWGGVVRDSQG